MLGRLLLIVLFLGLRLLPSFASDPVRYTVLLVGNRAGLLTTEILNSGARDFTFEYNDRGRGPKLHTRMILDPQGIPVSVETTGNDYLKSTVEEKFSIEQGKARWKNQGENGGKLLEGKAYYVSMNAVPEELGLLARALLSTLQKVLPLLPDGEARLERVGELELSAGGEKRIVTQYAITGLDFAPVSVWLNEEGNYFASVTSWLSAIREGWESALPELLKAQEEYSSVRASQTAGKLAHKLSGPLAILHSNLFDSETGTIRKNMTVIVSGNRIQAVGPDGRVRIPPEAEQIDAMGKVLMPGIWDMHVHLQETDGILDLAAGVTSVRDLANDIDTVMELRRKFNEGVAIGPRVILAGFIDSRGPYAGPSKVLADTEQEALDAVDRYAKLGYAQIKIYSSMKPELVPVIIGEAHKKGMRVSGHIPAFMTAEQAVRLGYDEIQHENFLFLNFLFDTVKDTRTPARFTAVAEHANELDLHSAKVENFIDLLQEHKTVIDPTINVFEELFTNRPGTVAPGYATVADRLPPQIRRSLLGGGLPVPEGMDQRYKDSFAAMLRMLKKLHDAGIPIVAGTDAMAGFALHRELELYAEAGIPTAKILQLATLGAASVMKKEKELGSIAPGKLADMILVDGNPVKNISDIRKVQTTIKDGVIYETAALYNAVGVAPGRNREEQ